MLCISAVHAVAVVRYLSVCMYASVRLSCSCILWKRINISFFKKNFRIAPHHSSFSTPNARQYSYGDSHTGASTAGGVGKNLDSRPISGYRIDDCCTCEQQLRRSTVDCSLSDRPPRISESRLSQPGLTTTTIEENKTDYTTVNLKPKLTIIHYITLHNCV